MLLDCLCKVCCNNVLQTVLIVLAQLNTAFMFLIYASNVCLASTDSNYKGLCFPSEGTYMAWAAFGLYFFGEFFLPRLSRRRGREGGWSPSVDAVALRGSIDDGHFLVLKLLRNPHNI